MRFSCVQLFSLGFLLLVNLPVSPSRAAETPAMHYSKPDVRKEIVTVVEAQLAAFRAHDLALAYTLAATGLRQQFTAQQFAVMIVRGYPVIANNQRAEFGCRWNDGTAAVVVADVFTADAHLSFRYALVKESAGWRIAGVTESKTRSTDA